MGVVWLLCLVVCFFLVGWLVALFHLAFFVVVCLFFSGSFTYVSVYVTSHVVKQKERKMFLRHPRFTLKGNQCL